MVSSRRWRVGLGVLLLLAVACVLIASRDREPPREFWTCGYPYRSPVYEAPNGRELIDYAVAARLGTFTARRPNHALVRSKSSSWYHSVLVRLGLVPDGEACEWPSVMVPKEASTPDGWTKWRLAD